MLHSKFLPIQFDSLITQLVATYCHCRYTESRSFRLSLFLFQVIIFACTVCTNILETRVFYGFNLKEEMTRKVSSKILNLDFL